MDENLLTERIYERQDEILVVLKRLDEWHTFSVAWVQRIEKEISTIKAHLKIG